ncbi:MAG: DUF1513 domain-containing protein [Proteobacteria bacterium]|nr:DUF1513 domain-containing protein [Pseudomonadota bacterium]
MAKLNRRRLLTRLGLMAGASSLSLINPFTIKAATATPTENTTPPVLKGVIYIVGENGTLLPEARGLTKEQCCVIRTLDLETGATKYAILPVHRGHVAIHAGNGNILVVGHHGNRNAFLDQNLNILKVLDAPKGYLFSGHGLYDPKRNYNIVPLRHEDPQSIKDTGLLQVYDASTLELVKTVSSGGLHPHEPKFIPGTDEIACTHYGELYTKSRPFIADVVEPKLSILDAETLAVKREYVQKDYAMLTHMDVDDEGNAYCVLTQAIKIYDTEKPWEEALRDADMQLQSLYNFQRDFPLSYHVADRKRIEIPLPMVRINTQTGERRDFFTGYANHMRGQSVAKNSVAKVAIGVFHHSDMIISHKTDSDQVFMIGAVDIGLTDIRGICEIPGTPYMAIAGSNRGVVIVDARNFSVIRRYNVETHENVHLSARVFA